MEEQHLWLPPDTRLGRHVVAKDGWFHGYIWDIYDNQFGQTFFSIAGQTLADGRNCLIVDVDPLSVFIEEE